MKNQKFYFEFENTKGDIVRSGCISKKDKASLIDYLKKHYRVLVIRLNGRVLNETTGENFSL